MSERGGDSDVPDDDEQPRGPRDGRSRASPPHRDAPPAQRADSSEQPRPTRNPVRWYFGTRNPLVVASRDVLTSVVLVMMIGLTLFAVSGVWPPMVAIESGSMEPNMNKGDLVVVVESDRFTSQSADHNGIVSQSDGERLGHEQFGREGSVVVYQPDGQERTPIIHRTEFAVEEGEDWVTNADPQYLGRVESCEDVPEVCPAPHDGYVTRGDANSGYDQIELQYSVVKPEWINGRAVARAPYLGCIRLELSNGPSCLDGR